MIELIMRNFRKSIRSMEGYGNMKGIVYALLAAFCTSCIGIFSSILMEQGLSSKEIAFMRCLRHCYLPLY